MKTTNHYIAPSEFKGIKDIEYFEFEEEFMENNMRCIPMIVRFKMDLAGIKLKLDEWSKFSVAEKIELAKKPCDHQEQINMYFNYVVDLIRRYTGREAAILSIDENPGWRATHTLPAILAEKLVAFGFDISTEQWAGLTTLRRFALMKLCRPGHENRNLPVALKEFGLL